MYNRPLSSRQSETHATFTILEIENRKSSNGGYSGGARKYFLEGSELKCIFLQ